MQYFLGQRFVATLINAFLRTLILAYRLIIFICSIIDLGRLRPPVAMVQRRNRLRQHLPDEVLAYVVLRLPAPPYELLQISTITKLHDDEYFGFAFIYEPIIIFYNIGMTQFSQNIDLRDNLLLFFFTHNAVIHLLPNQNAPVRNTSDFLDFAKGALANISNYFVLSLHNRVLNNKIEIIYSN